MSDEKSLSKQALKDFHSARETNGRGFGKETKDGSYSESYRDRLVGSILGAYEQAFGFESVMEEEIESDKEE